jgi:hypothetical protein
MQSINSTGGEVQSINSTGEEVQSIGGTGRNIACSGIAQILASVKHRI